MNLPEKKSLLALPLAAALSACGGSEENIQNITQVTQGDVFEKVFEGKVTDPAKIEQHPTNPRWVKLEQDNPVDYKTLRDLAAAGAQFRAVERIASGGGSVQMTYDCEQIDFFDNDGVLTCLGPKTSEGTEEAASYSSVTLGFDQGSAWYIPSYNEPDFAMNYNLTFWSSKNTPDSGAQK